MVAIEKLDDRVGVRERCRLVADHDQHLMGRPGEADHRIRDPRCGIDDERVEVHAQVTERLDEPRMLGLRQSGHLLDARGAGNDPDSTGALHHDLRLLALAADNVREVVGRVQAEHHVAVGEAEIGVEQHDAPLELGQRDGEVDRDIGLADPALAAGDGDDADGARRHQPTQPGRLIDHRIRGEHGLPLRRVPSRSARPPCRRPPSLRRSTGRPG